MLSGRGLRVLRRADEEESAELMASEVGVVGAVRRWAQSKTKATTTTTATASDLSLDFEDEVAMITTIGISLSDGME